MSREPHPVAAAEEEESGELLTPTPDEDGPHDVPDDKVIEKTLPTAAPPT